MPSLRASWATAATCGKRERLSEARAGLPLQRLELGIGGDQPASLVDPADDGARFRGCAGHRSVSRTCERAAIGRVDRQPGRAPLPLRSSVIASNKPIARPASVSPRRSPMLARKPATSSRRRFCHAEERHDALRRCRTEARSAAIAPETPARRPSASATKADLALVRGREDQFVVELAFSSSKPREHRRSARRCRARLPGPPSARWQALASSASAAAGPRTPGKSLAQSGRDRVDQDRAPITRGRSSKATQALAEAVAAPSAREDQRHRRRGNGAIVMADEPLERCARHAGRCAPSRRCAIRSSSARRSSSAISAGSSSSRATRQRLDERRGCFRRSPPAQPLGSAARMSSATSPTRQ